MARTKASVGAKISSGKSSKARCSVAPSVPTTSTGISGSDKSSRGSGGGNPVCPRETPKWQKPITNFFINKHNDSHESDVDGDTASSSIPKSKRNIIESSDDDATPEKPKNSEKPNNEIPDNETPDNETPDNETPNNEVPKNNELDESIELEALTGESSHKIEEYYPKGTKGKGKGKKTKETKHADSNGESKKEDLQNGDRKSSDFNENSNDSSNSESSGKGKGKGKKTKETKHADRNGESEKEDLQNGDRKSADLNENSNDSSNSESSGKGKGKGKKTKETKHADSNGESEKEDLPERNENKSDSESKDKENIDTNVEKERDIANDKDTRIVGRKKREREDTREEESNINKKTKVN